MCGPSRASRVPAFLGSSATILRLAALTPHPLLALGRVLGPPHPSSLKHGGYSTSTWLSGQGAPTASVHWLFCSVLWTHCFLLPRRSTWALNYHLSLGGKVEGLCTQPRSLRRQQMAHPECHSPDEDPRCCGVVFFLFHRHKPRLTKVEEPVGITGSLGMPGLPACPQLLSHLSVAGPQQGWRAPCGTPVLCWEQVSATSPRWAESVFAYTLLKA